ncbi:MAG: DUF3108 domain-containing protein [Pseudomonadota bacterium]
MTERRYQGRRPGKGRARLSAGAAGAAIGMACCAGLSVAAPLSGLEVQPASALKPAVSESGLKDLDQIYDIYLGGLWIAEMSVTSEIEGDRYSAGAALVTKGVVGSLYRASFEVEAEGEVGAGLYAPQRFTASSRDTRKSQFVEMRYDGGKPAALRAEPAFKPKPWEVDPLAQAGAADPLSAALGVLANQQGDGLCDREVEIFDGRRRYAIVLGAPALRESGVRCPAVYRRVAGYKPKKMAEPEFPFEFWFEQGADGSWQVQKALGDTPIGTAVIRRRVE